jgi:hypothetical protein
VKSPEPTVSFPVAEETIPEDETGRGRSTKPRFRKKKPYRGKYDVTEQDEGVSADSQDGAQTLAKPKYTKKQKALYKKQRDQERARGGDETSESPPAAKKKPSKYDAKKDGKYPPKARKATVGRKGTATARPRKHQVAASTDDDE